MDHETLILGRADALAPGDMRSVEVAGQKILLVHDGARIRALGAECPHAGAPLAEGVFADGRVICPWHKASFCVATGQCADPPAVDDVPTYHVEIIKGDILLAGPGRLPAVATPAATDHRRFVILGAGGAGFSAAQALRQNGFAGALLMVSPEDHLPYDRTVLGKYTLAGTSPGEKTPLQDEQFFIRHEIERRVATAVEIDGQSKRVKFADGTDTGYDALLIATGGAAKQAPFTGGDLRNVFTLRSPADAARITEAAANSRRAVVTGAGFIGMEAAAALRERGLEVTVVAQEEAPFALQLGALVGNIYKQLHEEKGVTFRFNAQVEALEGDGHVQAVRLADGTRIPVDIVVVGLGMAPTTEFAASLPRTDDNALPVDRYLRVADDVFAAGDVASFPLYGDGPAVRVEHWRVAAQQGRVAARNMLGHSDSFDAVPYFWTIQYKVRLDYVGHASGSDLVVMRGEPAARTFIAYYVRDGIVAAAAGMNQDQDMAAIITLMTRRQNWTVDELHPASRSPIDVLKAASPQERT